MMGAPNSGEVVQDSKKQDGTESPPLAKDEHGLPKTAPPPEPEGTKHLSSSPDDDQKDIYGVLLADRIRHYAATIYLITPFEENKLKAAGYRLTLGSQYWLGSRGRDNLTTEKPILTIPPYDVAVINTAQRIKMPKFLIGRWNIKVGLIYEGVVLVSGAQVDPGFDGELPCVLYNFSNKDVVLKLGDHVATIDFVKTTRVTEEYLPFEQKRFKFDDYVTGFKSQPFLLAGEMKKLAEDLKDKTVNLDKELRRRIEELEDRVTTFSGLVLGIVLAVIALLVTIVFGLRVR